MSMEHEEFKASLKTIEESLKAQPRFQPLYRALSEITPPEWIRFHISKDDYGILYILNGLKSLLGDTKDDDFENKFICDLIDLYDTYKDMKEDLIQKIAKALDAFIKTYPPENLSPQTIETINAHKQEFIKDDLSQNKTKGSTVVLLAADNNDMLIQKITQLLATESKKLTDTVTELLKKINRLAIDNQMSLAQQSDTALKQLLAEVLKDSPKSPEMIFGLVNEHIKQEDEAIKQRAALAAQDTRLPLHQNPSKTAWMQDQDMTALMPKSCVDIDVFAPLNLQDEASIAAFQEAIKGVIDNNTIKHIVVPIGPVHWQGLYLSKPTEQGDNYQLEIFDSYGITSAKRIESNILNILNIPSMRPIETTFSQPRIPQTDGYSCGDYVCAYSHQKMKALNPEAPVNDKLIEALESGNATGELRKVTREISAENRVIAPSVPQPQATPLAPPPISSQTPPPSFPDKESFKSQLQKFPVKKGWHLALDDNHKTQNEYIIQSIDEKKYVHRDRDVLVTPGKVSATLTSDKHDMAYKQELAAIMIQAAVISGIPVDKIEVKCEDAEMCEALQAEIDRRLGASLSSDDTEEIVLAPKGP